MCYNYEVYASTGKTYVSVYKQLNLVIPLQNVRASIKWPIYKSLQKIFKDTK